MTEPMEQQPSERAREMTQEEPAKAYCANCNTPLGDNDNFTYCRSCSWEIEHGLIERLR